MTENKVKVDPLSPVGIAADALTMPQRDLLMKVVEAYTGAMADNLAAERMAQLKKAGHREDHVRVGRGTRARQEALLPGAGAHFPD